MFLSILYSQVYGKTSHLKSSIWDGINGWETVCVQLVVLWKRLHVQMNCNDISEPQVKTVCLPCLHTRGSWPDQLVQAREDSQQCVRSPTVAATVRKQWVRRGRWGGTIVTRKPTWGQSGFLRDHPSIVSSLIPCHPRSWVKTSNLKSRSLAPSPIIITSFSFGFC
jgi:hypothetical protein